MATINLGRIKPVFQGAYNAGTAYVVDDIVTSGGETFICILASTCNATSNATYWSKLAKKGDDVTQLTTHGDFLFRDASGVQRLAAGTSGQVLQTKGNASDPTWASATGITWDYKKANFTAVSGGAYICNTGDEKGNGVTGGWHNAAEAIVAIKFAQSTGNIEKGFFKMFRRVNA